MKIIASAFCLLLGACSTNLFAPTYSKELETSANKAYTAVASITACIELGSCLENDGFEKQEKDYTTAISNLKSSKILASSLKISSRSITAKQAKDDLISFIDECHSQVMVLADFHKKSIIPSGGGGITQPVDTVCDQMLRSTQALK